MPDEELDVSEAEGIVRVVGVFPRPEQEEECDDDHVRRSLVEGSRGRRAPVRRVRQSSDASNNLDGYRFNPKWGWVGCLPGFYRALQAEVNVVGRV